MKRARSLRWGRALVVAGVLAIILFALLRPSGVEHPPSLLGGGRQPGSSNSPKSSQALIDSIGVVVHFNYVDTSYARQADILDLLRSLGVHHIRDAMPAAGIPLAAGLQAAARQGITATLATGEVAIPPLQAVDDALSVLGRNIFAFEGPNELDNSGDPAWPQILRAYMPALAAAVRQRAPGVALIQPSFVDPASRQRVPDLPGLYNEHPYPLGGPPEPALEQAIAELPAGAINDGVVFTETGYHNALHSTDGPPPVPEQVAAVYLPRLLVSDFAEGVRSSFIYELADEKPDPALGNSEEHYGLVRYDLSPKPAFLAIRNMILALQASPGGEPGHRPTVRVDAANDTWRLRLARPDGSQVLALWRPVSVWDPIRREPRDPPLESADVSFGGGARDVTVWRPSLSSAPVERITKASRLQLELGADLVLLSFQ